MELINALRSPDEMLQLNTMGALHSLAAAKESSRNVISNAGDLLPTLQVSICCFPSHEKKGTCHQICRLYLRFGSHLAHHQISCWNRNSGSSAKAKRAGACLTKSKTSRELLCVEKRKEHQSSL